MLQTRIPGAGKAAFRPEVQERKAILILTDERIENGAGILVDNNKLEMAIRLQVEVLEKPGGLLGSTNGRENQRKAHCFRVTSVFGEKPK
jgi:hypothetical protein